MVAGPSDRFSSSGHAPPNGEPDLEPPNDDPPAGPAALRQLLAQWAELNEYARFYVAARADAIKGSLRRAAMWLVVAALGLVVVGSLLITAVVVMVLGISESIGHALGDRFWAGNLITGCGLLAIFALIVALAFNRLASAARERTVRKYEQRRQQQQARFGEDVGGRAAHSDFRK